MQTVMMRDPNSGGVKIPKSVQERTREHTDICIELRGSKIVIDIQRKPQKFLENFKKMLI